MCGIDAQRRWRMAVLAVVGIVVAVMVVAVVRVVVVLVESAVDYRGTYPDEAPCLDVVSAPTGRRRGSRRRGRHGRPEE